MTMSVEQIVDMLNEIDDAIEIVDRYVPEGAVNYDGKRVYVTRILRDYAGFLKMLEVNIGGNV